MIYTQSSLSHHLFQITIGELVAAIPPDAQKDDSRFEVESLERGLMLLHEDDSERMMGGRFL
jgi:hypothetical protein